MKEIYSEPSMEVVQFSALDVITTSLETTTTEWVPRENGDQMENSGWMNLDF